MRRNHPSGVHSWKQRPFSDACTIPHAIVEVPPGSGLQTLVTETVLKDGTIIRDQVGQVFLRKWSFNDLLLMALTIPPPSL